MKSKYKVTVDLWGLRTRYLDGKFHREDGPAFEHFGGHKVWYLNGYLHREDGPAVVDIEGEGRWFLHGKRITKEEHLRMTDFTDE